MGWFNHQLEHTFNFMQQAVSLPMSFTTPVVSSEETFHAELREALALAESQWPRHWKIRFLFWKGLFAVYNFVSGEGNVIIMVEKNMIKKSLQFVGVLNHPPKRQKYSFWDT